MTDSRVATAALFSAGLIATCNNVGSGQTETHLPEGIETSAGRIVSTPEGERIVEQLASRNDAESEDALLRIALGKDLMPWPSVRIKAIEALAQRDRIDVPSRLARLLVPHEGLPIRQSVSEALARSGCDAGCMRFVLAYLNRVYLGESNIEEVRRRKDLSRYRHAAAELGLSAEVSELQPFYAGLYKIVGSNAGSSLRVLVGEYGLGTRLPSAFGIEVLTKTSVAGSCDLLEKSLRNNDWWTDDERRSLEGAIRKQDCQSKGIN